ncbi:MAG: cation:proton antiporter [Candidatus Caldatribacteriota bacterium]|jgi:multicomponent Na+:H+ antiporter subunit F|nr:cation:proton antiporter [Atribacterota bacterium]MDD3031304.1 cation:proton antiporter [Atribacterota bacterium]MDD3640406.1 cation:proton antiporter [Atribacterota bacterium]MDD4288198.1 cation:proton antiporter [Atribacterota bacterium]MDD4764425.1 cation:proton antiporter [Atribacterota bacterium]
MNQILNIFLISAIALVIFMLISLFRLILGPTIPDRVVALDTINTLIIAGMILFGAAFEEVIYIDVAIVYALLSYIATLYIANYMERRAKDK